MTLPAGQSIRQAERLVDGQLQGSSSSARLNGRRAR